MANTHLTTAVKIRFPNEVLEALNAWAALNHLPRSVAVRRLILRSMTTWQDDPSASCECEGGTGECPCGCEGAEECSGARK